MEARATATSERPAKPRTEKRGALPMELKPGSERDPIYFQQDPSVQTWSTNVPWQTNKCVQQQAGSLALACITAMHIMTLSVR